MFREAGRKATERKVLFTAFTAGRKAGDGMPEQADVYKNQEAQKERYEAFRKEIAAMEPAERDARLWEGMIGLQGTPFYTARKLRFTYTIRGGELFVDRKSKSITQSTVFIAFHKALELEGIVTGPKKLGTFGASYLYPVFLELGVICPDNSIQEKESIL